MQPSYPEGEQSKISLPQITNETRDRLKEEVPDEMDMFFGSRKFAKDVFGSLVSSNRSLVEGIYRELHRVKPGYDNQHSIDDYAIGMAVVLRAFDINSDFRLMEKFKELTSDDIGKGIGVVKETMDEEVSAKSIFASVLRAPVIPEHQVNLRSALHDFETGLGNSETELGGQMMYKILEDLWPKLQSNNGGESPQEPPTLPPVQPPFSSPQV